MYEIEENKEKEINEKHLNEIEDNIDNEESGNTEENILSLSGKGQKENLINKEYKTEYIKKMEIIHFIFFMLFYI